MIGFTKDRIEQFIKKPLEHGLNRSEQMEMARQLLAGLEQEPVYQACKEAGVWVDIEPGDAPSLRANGEQVRVLYAAPQLPQPDVPDALERLLSIVADPKALPRRKEWISGQQYSYVLLENVEAMVDEACRAAMLQGAEPVSQPYTLRAGWVAVPVEATLDMVKAGAKAASDGFLIPGVFRAMLAAAPQQEVHFKTTSDERLMKTPDITGETVKVIGSFNDDVFCHKHPDTPRLKHPYMQLMVYPPRPATYCPKCEPHVAEWEDRDKKLRKGKGVK